MTQTENFFLKLFEGTDKFDYKTINENWQKIDNAMDELLNGGNVAILPTVTVEKIENGYKITTHDAKGSHSFELFNGGAEIPTKVSQLENDSGYFDEEQVVAAIEDYLRPFTIPTKLSDLKDDSSFVDSEELDEYMEDKIPTKTSDLENDSGFVTDNDIIPVYVASESDFEDTSKKYVLPNGWVYEWKEGESTAYNYATDMEINKRVSDGNTINANGYITTPFIPITWEEPYVIKIRADAMYHQPSSPAFCVEGYDMYENMKGSCLVGLDNYIDGTLTVELSESLFTDGAPPAMLRICVRLSEYYLEEESDLVKNLFIELPSESSVSGTSEWAKTNLRYVPDNYEEVMASYGDRLTVLENSTLTEEDKSSIVAEVLAALPNASGVSF